jgi:hypothetical protein
MKTTSALGLVPSALVATSWVVTVIVAVDAPAAHTAAGSDVMPIQTSTPRIP